MSDPTDHQELVKIKNYTVHPKWKPDKFPSHDFVIITLDTKLEFGHRIQRANIPKQNEFNKKKR